MNKSTLVKDIAAKYNLKVNKEQVNEIALKYENLDVHNIQSPGHSTEGILQTMHLHREK